MRLYLAVAFMLGFIGVLMGALGAHALNTEDIAPERLADLKQNWRTGTSYLFFHVLAGLVCARFASRNQLFVWSGGILMTGGTLFASGIWIGALSEAHGLPFEFLGIIAPIGGLTMMSGWLLGMLAVFRNSSS